MRTRQQGGRVTPRFPLFSSFLFCPCRFSLRARPLCPCLIWLQSPSRKTRMAIGWARETREEKQRQSNKKKRKTKKKAPRSRWEYKYSPHVSTTYLPT
ncbi:hypothetical protein LX36DRAFT_211814 [Colletotrichum falcatum]|nr:hypothetical protein LX36DRAFT_211814 [Colletotrichum falcatum]